jgi:hypothetical protein
MSVRSWIISSILSKMFVFYYLQQAYNKALLSIQGIRQKLINKWVTNKIHTVWYWHPYFETKHVLYSRFPQSWHHALSLQWLKPPPSYFTMPADGWMEAAIRNPTSNEDVTLLLPSESIVRYETICYDMITQNSKEWKVPPYTVFYGIHDITPFFLGMKPSFSTNNLKVTDLIKFAIQKGALKAQNDVDRVEVLRSDTFDTITFKETDILELIH